MLHVHLVYLLLITNITLRFFTNYFGVLPRALNLLDVGITFVIVALVFFTKRNDASSTDPFNRSFSRRLFWFNVVLLLGALMNVGAMYLPAAVAQTIMLNEPILLFIVLVKLPLNVSQVERYDNILRRLVLLEFVLGVIQFPIYLSTGNSEAIVGTFYGNAEQYTGLLLLGICYYVGKITVCS